MDGGIVKRKLIDRFHEYGLELTFREIDTRDKRVEIEFLDILHCSDEKSPHGFKFKKIYKTHGD